MSGEWQWVFAIFSVVVVIVGVALAIWFFWVRRLMGGPDFVIEQGENPNGTHIFLILQNRPIEGGWRAWLGLKRTAAETSYVSFDLYNHLTGEKRISRNNVSFLSTKD